MLAWTNSQLDAHVDRSAELERRWDELLLAPTVRLGGRPPARRVWRQIEPIRRVPMLGDALVRLLRSFDRGSSQDERETNDPAAIVAGSEFLYRPTELLIDDVKVYDAIVSGRVPTATLDGPIGGWRRVSWASPGIDALLLRNQLRATLTGVRIEVNHVLTFEPRYSFKPDGPPLETAGDLDGYEPIPAHADPKVLVTVIDTGLPESALAEHDDLEHRATPVDDPLFVGGTSLHDVGGHGTFVAARVLQRSERAVVVSRTCAHADGFTDEWTVATELDAALVKDGSTVVNLSLGGYTSQDAGLPVIERLIPKSDYPIVVAAAGNEGVAREFFPAALGHVVGVAGLDAKHERARFSNHGSWVDACAVGAGVVANFPKGLARWSGTSFAAPVVSGAIADKFHGEIGRHELVAEVLQAHGSTVEGCGPVVT